MEVAINDLLKIYNDEVSKNTKNKRKVYNFEKYRMINIAQLKRDLETKKYCMQKYNIFYISEPKLRIIMSLGIRDRLVDHYLTRYILLPRLEKYLDIRNVASRKNMGLNYGMGLVKKYLEKLKKYDSIYALKIDISKFFYTIDHEVLKRMLRDKLTSEEYELICLFIDSTDDLYVNEEITRIKNNLLSRAKDNNQKQEIWKVPFYEKGKGLTIGNVSSQILSIFYLSEIDFYIINHLRCKYMVRYCDDIVVFHYNKDYLIKVLACIKNKLLNYELSINEKKSNISNLKDGIIFCGNLVKIDGKKTVIRKSRKNRDRIKRNLKKKTRLYNLGKISFRKYFNSVSTLKKF